MAKAEPMGIRLEPEEREALARAAVSDDRTPSALARKIIADWLKREGWLKPAKVAAKMKRRGREQHQAD